jgi:hypothetical protein
MLVKSTIKILVLTFCILLGSLTLKSHDLHRSDLPEKEWKLLSGKSLFGHYYLFHNNLLTVERNNGTFTYVAYSQLSEDDKKFVTTKEAEIARINDRLNHLSSSNKNTNNPSNYKNIPDRFLYYSILLLIVLTVIPGFRKTTWVQQIAVPCLLTISLLSMSFTLQKFRKTSFDTRISFIDSAFSYFKPDVNTRSDANWYYVESLGLPAHETMIGIKSWQQQVPIPQCYIGSNAWSIPLHPQIATSPVPVNTKHFLRGAIAIAVNGIPIFSPYTNTGVDAFIDGQLDQYGGHSGRADDYHYHTAPTVLFNKIPQTSPLAFALDGFAIYGNIEPDGNQQLPLDSNHGHFGKDGTYHYHISNTAPYMIKNMVGKVTEDTTMQIIPQAAAKGCRPALTPLKGAVITHNIPYPNGNGFILSYTLNGNSDTIDYSWTPQGNYTYVFKTPTTKTISNYKGNPICTVPQNSKKSFTIEEFHVFATADRQLIIQDAETISRQCKRWKIIGFDGRIVLTGNQWANPISAVSLSPGTYWLTIQTIAKSYTSKFIIVE